MAMALGLKPFSLCRRGSPLSSNFALEFHVQQRRPFSDRSCSNFWRQTGCARRVGGGLVVRARGGGGGHGDGGNGNEEKPAMSGAKRRFVTPDLESVEGDGPEEEEEERRRPFWQRFWGFGNGSRESRSEESRGQRELEELDVLLEGGGFDFQWRDVLQPSVENVLALLLTVLLLYAVTLIGWQLLVVAAAITLSALKYSVIAGIILGVLVFLI